MQRLVIVTALCLLPLASLGAYGEDGNSVNAETRNQFKAVKDPNKKGVTRTYSAASEQVGIEIINNAEAIRAEEAKDIEEFLTNDNPDDDNFYLMIQGFGGLSGYYEFLYQASPRQIEALHMGYGVGGLNYGDKSSTSPTVPAEDSGEKKIEMTGVMVNCPIVWAPQWRNRSYNVGSIIFRTNTYITVDGAGRSGQAGIGLAPRGLGEALYRPCADRVRATGVAGDQAGHLIAFILGGGNYRTNFVPQNGTLNQGIWQSRIESAARKCANKVSIYGYYNVRPIYNFGGLRPSHLRATMFAYRLSDTDIRRMASWDFPNRSPDTQTRGKAENWSEVFDIFK